MKNSKKEDKGAYKYENVVSSMSKSLVGVGDPQSRTKE